MGFVWLFTINSLIPARPADSQETIGKPVRPVLSFRSLLFHSGLIPIMVIILLQGILRDGITTWMPSYINDVYHFGTSISILSAAILPLFAIISVFAASYVHKLAKNEVKASAYIWILGFVCSLVLILVFSSQAIVSIAMMAIITGCMHGINIMLISILPARYKNTGRVSTVSGILNAFTYAGSAVSTYGIAALSDNYGWKTTIITWCIIALGGLIINLSVFKTLGKE
jgi:OPA family glycerol-3-phosphate transporter-like MFS transporter